MSRFMRILLSMLMVFAFLSGLLPVSAAGGNDEHVNDTDTLADTAVLMPAEMNLYQKAAALHELGRFDGISTTVFDPGFTAPLTREQAMKVILQTLAASIDTAVRSPFDDVSAWAQPYVAKAHAMGITSGRTSHTFGGTDRVTVRELLTFYLRAMGENGTAAYQNTYQLASDKGLLRSLAFEDQASLSAEATREDLVVVACDSMEELARRALTNKPDGGGAEDEDVVFWTLVALQNRDFKRLAVLSHPVKGVLFSADPQIDEPYCTHVMPDKLKSIFENDTSLLWGVSGITGEPVQLSYDAFENQHINRVNYRESYIRVTYGLVTARGNAPLNYQTVLPEATAVEFFYPGTEAVEGKDFSSLILLFEAYEGRIYLVGVLSNYWMV